MATSERHDRRASALGAALALALACGGHASPEALGEGSAEPAASGGASGRADAEEAGGSANVSDGSSFDGSSGGAAAVALGIATAACASSVYAYRQEDVDALEGCEVLYGSLTVFGPVDLRPLHALREVRGELSVSTPSLEGLENLERVSYTVALDGLRAATLAPLSKLRVEGPVALRISNCENLESLEGLNLTGPFVQLSISENDNLATLDPVKVTDTDAYPPLIEIQGNPNLTGMDALAEVTAGSRITLGQLAVEDLSWLGRLRAADELMLSDMPRLVDASLPNIESVGRFSLALLRQADPPTYPRLAALRALALFDNAELLEPPRLPLLADPSSGWQAAVAVMNNPKLESLVLPGLVASDDIGLRNNDHLVTASFPNLARITAGSRSPPGGHLTVVGNASLTTLGFEDLEMVALALQVQDNPSLGRDQLDPLISLAPPSIKTGANLEDRSALDPCPWAGDFECDEPPLSELCALGADSKDCARFRAE